MTDAPGTTLVKDALFYGPVSGNCPRIAAREQPGFMTGGKDTSREPLSSGFRFEGQVVTLHRIPFGEVRSDCRQKLETCELWLRRLIQEEFSQRFGPSYFSDGVYNGAAIFRKEIREHAALRMTENPGRNAREIWALALSKRRNKQPVSSVVNAFRRFCHPVSLIAIL